MRPIVRDEWDQFDQQTRAYAEYRVFSKLTTERACARNATVTLDCVRDSAGPRTVVCTITVVTVDGHVVHATAVDQHPCAAIDLAASRIGPMIRGAAS